ncbi:YezD family protein [Hydrocarboniphaga effusa]|uniref:YezD family protein n=1 Tax=Hydrocarboniphaga effusa TaxID=243629 RepID=UPI003137897E
MNAQIHRLDETEARLAERIVQAIRGLRYGSVEIVVHDGRVVQFERRERVRFDRNEESTAPRR